MRYICKGGRHPPFCQGVRCPKRLSVTLLPLHGLHKGCGIYDTLCQRGDGVHVLARLVPRALENDKPSSKSAMFASLIYSDELRFYNKLSPSLSTTLVHHGGGLRKTNVDGTVFNNVYNTDDDHCLWAWASLLCSSAAACRRTRRPRRKIVGLPWFRGATACAMLVSTQRNASMTGVSVGIILDIFFIFSFFCENGPRVIFCMMCVHCCVVLTVVCG